MTMGTRAPDGTHAGVLGGARGSVGGPWRLLHDACRPAAPSSILRLGTSGLGSLPNGAKLLRLPRGLPSERREEHAAVDDNERERFREYWLEKYGDPIDSPDLSNAARGGVDGVGAGSAALGVGSTRPRESW